MARTNLATHGGRHGGYALFVLDGRLHHIYNFVGLDYFHVASDDVIEPGAHELRYQLRPTGRPDLAVGHGSPGNSLLSIDGRCRGRALSAHDNQSDGAGRFQLRLRRLRLRRSRPHGVPFRFSGTIHRLTIDISGDLHAHDEAELRSILASSDLLGPRLRPRTC